MRKRRKTPKNKIMYSTILLNPPALEFTLSEVEEHFRRAIIDACAGFDHPAATLQRQSEGTVMGFFKTKWANRTAMTLYRPSDNTEPGLPIFSINNEKQIDKNIWHDIDWDAQATLPWSQFSQIVRYLLDVVAKSNLKLLNSALERSPSMTPADFRMQFGYNVVGDQRWLEAFEILGDRAVG